MLIRETIEKLLDEGEVARDVAAVHRDELAPGAVDDFYMCKRRVTLARIFHRLRNNCSRRYENPVNEQDSYGHICHGVVLPPLYYHR